MDERRGWLQRRDGWWHESNTGFKVKFTEEAEKKFNENDSSILRLQHVVQYVTHVQRFSGLGLKTFFDAMNLSEPSLVQYVRLENNSKTEVPGSDLLSQECYYHPRAFWATEIAREFEILGRAIEGGCLQNLKCLEVSKGIGHYDIAKAIASGRLSSLQKLSLHHVRLTAYEAEMYRKALLSGTVPSLCCLDIPADLLVEMRPVLKNVAELTVRSLSEDRAVDEPPLLSLIEALKSGHLDSMELLDLQNLGYSPSETLATALVAAFSSNDSLTVDVKYQWYAFPELDRRRKQLLERNIRRRDISADLVPVPKVQARIGERRGWLQRRDGWWHKSDMGFEVKFTEEAEKKFFENHSSKLRLQDVVQYVTHVQRSSSLGLNPGLKTFFDAMNLSQPSLVQYVRLQNTPLTEVREKSLQSKEHGYPSAFKIESDFKNLGRAIEGGYLQNLKCLELSKGRGHSTVAKAIASGGLSSLQKLSLQHVRLTAYEAREYKIALRSGMVPSLCCLDIPADLLEEVRPILKNLAELTIHSLSQNRAVDEPILLSLVEALKSGHLDSMKLLDLLKLGYSPSKTLATALVAAFSSNDSLTVDVKYQWYEFPELDRRQTQLLERNIRHRDILAGLVAVPKVQATIGKVYVCGNPEVGKTTLRRTLQRSYWTSLITWERRPHVEKRTRGIDVSQLSSKGNKPDENPITLQVWDMAGQEDFHVVHNAFFPDLGSAEGKATTFIATPKMAYVIFWNSWNIGCDILPLVVTKRSKIHDASLLS